VPEKSWKVFERRVSNYFGTVRTALSGGNSKVTRSDTHHPDLFVECKQRLAWSVITLWDEVARLARLESRREKHEGKIPVVCLSQANRPGFWLLIHSDDLNAVARAHSLAPMTAYVPEEEGEE